MSEHRWPTDVAALIAEQDELAAAADAASGPWVTADGGPVLGGRVLGGRVLGGCWVCFPKGVSGPGSAGDPVWAAAVALRGGRVVAEAVITGEAGASYLPGLLALRVGAVMERAVRALTTRPDVLLLDAGGRDHPRRAGLALHLGAVLDLPTIGVTHRPLLARGGWPGEERGDTSPLRIDDEVVGCWLRTQRRVRPLAVHPGWRTDLSTAVSLVEATTRHQRTPEPLRLARRLARRARAAAAAGQGPSTRSR